MPTPLSHQSYGLLACCALLLALVLAPNLAYAQLLRPTVEAFSVPAGGGGDTKAVAALFESLDSSRHEATWSPLPDSVAKVLTALFVATARFARDSTGALIAAFDARINDPVSADVAAKAGSNRARMAQVTAVALDDVSLDLVLDALQGPDRASVRADAVAIRQLIGSRARKATMVSLFADGTVRSAVKGDSSGGTAGTGSLGVGIGFASGISLTVSVGLASSVDTVKQSFGSVILTPGVGKGFLSNFIIEGRSQGFWHGVGARAYVAGGNSVWAPDPLVRTVEGGITDTLVASPAVAAIAQLGIGVYRDVLAGYFMDSPIRVGFEGGYSGRFIGGDAIADSTLLIIALGQDDKRSYHGFELGLRLQLGTIAAAAQGYWLFKGHEGRPSVRGLTGPQLVIGISVQGPIVRGPVTESMKRLGS